MMLRRSFLQTISVFALAAMGRWELLFGALEAPILEPVDPWRKLAEHACQRYPREPTIYMTLDTFNKLNELLEVPA